jgi:hypothetical protein
MQGEAMRSEAEIDAVAFPVTVDEAWPVTVEAADVLSGRARLTHELIKLRIVAGKSPTSDANAHDENPYGCHMVEMLDALPDAYERAQIGLRQATIGETESVGDL